MRKSVKRARIAQWVLSIIALPIILKESIKYGKFLKDTVTDSYKINRISDFVIEYDLDHKEVCYDIIRTKLELDASKGSVGAALILKIFDLSAKIGCFDSTKEYSFQYAEKFGI